MRSTQLAIFFGHPSLFWIHVFRNNIVNGVLATHHFPQILRSNKSCFWRITMWVYWTSSTKLLYPFWYALRENWKRCKHLGIGDTTTVISLKETFLRVIEDAAIWCNLNNSWWNHSTDEIIPLKTKKDCYFCEGLFFWPRLHNNVLCVHLQTWHINHVHQGRPGPYRGIRWLIYQTRYLPFSDTDNCRRTVEDLQTEKRIRVFFLR